MVWPDIGLSSHGSAIPATSYKGGITFDSRLRPFGYGVASVRTRHMLIAKHTADGQAAIVCH
jgi:hypothetical protein